MERHFSFKVKLMDDLLSVKSVFDKGAIGDIDGRSYFVNAFWFDRDLYVKYIEVTTAGPDPESVFVVPAAAFISNGVLTLPRSGNFVKSNPSGGGQIGSGLPEKLAWISGKGIENEARGRIGDDDFIVRDFLIDTHLWKIAAAGRGNWASGEATKISKLIDFDKNNSYQFAA
jgi:hypothetical protein